MVPSNWLSTALLEQEGWARWLLDVHSNPPSAILHVSQQCLEIIFEIVLASSVHRVGYSDLVSVLLAFLIIFCFDFAVEIHV